MNSQEEVAVGNKDALLPGDLIWIKHPRDFWWPGVVITKNEAKNTGKKSDRLKNVTVRLYGRNKCIKVEQNQCLMDLQDFQRNYSNYTELLINGMKRHVISKISKLKNKKEHTGEATEVSPSKEKRNEVKMAIIAKKSKDDSAKTNGTKENRDESEKLSVTERSKDDIVKKKSKKVKKDELSNEEKLQTTKKQKVMNDELKDMNVSRRVKIMRFIGLCPPVGSHFSYV